MTINISGINKAEKTIDEYGLDFDYLQGRVLKVHLSDDELDPWLYDRDIGQGAAERIINTLR